MAYLTNADLDAKRKRMKADPEDHRCPNCFGWGFPIMALGGKEAYNVNVVCPDCRGAGRTSA